MSSSLLLVPPAGPARGLEVEIDIYQERQPGKWEILPVQLNLPSNPAAAYETASYFLPISTTRYPSICPRQVDDQKPATVLQNDADVLQLLRG